MEDLRSRFDQAISASKSLAEKPDNPTLLQLYGLYKQASAGDATGERPGFGDFVARAKWDAWRERRGEAPEAAMQQYVDLIESLK